MNQSSGSFTQRETRAGPSHPGLMRPVGRIQVLGGGGGLARPMRGQFQCGGKNMGFGVDPAGLMLALPFAGRATLDK